MSFHGRAIGWHLGSAAVDGNLDSDAPSWVLTATWGRGNSRVYLATGPLATRPRAERIARILNDLDPERWERFIDYHLPQLLEHWG